MHKSRSSVFAVALLLAACSQPPASTDTATAPGGTGSHVEQAPAKSAEGKRAPGADAVVATVGSRAITQGELEHQVSGKLIEIESQRYEALRQGLEQMIAEELYAREAQARGTTVETLAKQEVEDKVSAPTAEQIQQVYDGAKEEIGDQPLDSVRPRIVAFLREQQQAERNQAFVAELKQRYKPTVSLRPPTVNVGDGGRPARGNAKAPVTIIEFADYECAFCRRSAATIDQVLKTYGDKIRFVWRDYPLPFHEHARPAAEAARCAEAQGRFWEYHDKLFAGEDLAVDRLKELATAVGLDRAKFDACLTQTPSTASIDKDIADGSSAGVRGTPAFFINGRFISGAQPFETFKEAIDDELSRVAEANG